MEERLKTKLLNKSIKNLNDFHIGDIIQVGPNGSHRLELITGRDTYQMISVCRVSPKEIVWRVRATDIERNGLYERIYETFKRDSGDLAQQIIYQALDQLLNEHGIAE